jgi:DNA-binding response OmpR family regulator
MHDKSRKVVFIVDDDPDDRQLILDALSENDKSFEYVPFSSAEHLHNELNSNGSKIPDLIILDLNMPGVMGLHALKEIRNNKSLKYIPIVILTTSTLEKDKKLSYEYGANCFLTKPHSYKKMAVIANALISLWLIDSL